MSATTEDATQNLLEQLIKVRVDKAKTNEEIVKEFIDKFGYPADLVNQILNKLRPPVIAPTVPVESLVTIPSITLQAQTITQTIQAREPEIKVRLDIPPLTLPPVTDKAKPTLNYQFNINVDYFPTVAQGQSPNIDSVEVEDGFENIIKSDKGKLKN